MADDYLLGEGIRRLGLRLHLSRLVVDDIVGEPGLGHLWRHERRWLRTLRQLEPGGYAGMAVTHPVAWALIALPFAGFSGLALGLLGLALLARAYLVYASAAALRLVAATPWLLPARDLLSFALWVGGYFGGRLAWRDQRLVLGPGGRLGSDGERQS